ncbi:hypothetical protein CIPAW_01G048700 [Carya illinoinensis]|uniref:Retrovirus-related Pol polyprotein from transposon TNT 1-94-like beta-barrel domain-containing protein n=1 Tax=Carya illinoinensis TaxID=32201 RepID=A0A8T1RJ03_CARIL|nr:hypothetical protein CIPAW_01G048700 [Carya illinoinensis]
MLRPPVPAYSEVVTLLESYTDRYKLDVNNSSMVFYGQKQSKNKKPTATSGFFTSKGKGFVQGSSAGSKSNTPQTQNYSNNHRASSSNHGYANRQEITCQICNKRNHTALKCFERFNHSFTDDNLPQSFATIKLEERHENTSWHLDIGATDHMIANEGILHSLTPYQGHDGIMVGNGKVLPITHVGQAIVGSSNSQLLLNDVLVVPEIKKNLLSVSKLTTAYPLQFEFDGTGFVLKDRET